MQTQRFGVGSASVDAIPILAKRTGPQDHDCPFVSMLAICFQVNLP
jgi:hypothetical protein